MPGLKRVNNQTFVKAFQAIDRKIINPIFMMQFFLPLATLGVAAFYAYEHGVGEAVYVYAALACYAIAVIVTIAVNVPLNDGLKKLTTLKTEAEYATARARFSEAKWRLFNNIRLIFSLIALVCVVVAITVYK